MFSFKYTQNNFEYLIEKKTHLVIQIHHSMLVLVFHVISCEQLVFFKHVFTFTTIFQRINLLPLISTIYLIRGVIPLISLTKNVNVDFFCFSIILRESYILKKIFLFIQFLVYLFVHMVMYLFDQKEYNAYHQNSL